VTISALNDTLTEDKFAAIMRRRRDSAGWARTILGEALERGHWKLASRALDHLAEHQPDWRFPALKARIRRQRMAQARGRRAASLRAWAGSDAETGITGS
jgi:hypothetical protein